MKRSFWLASVIFTVCIVIGILAPSGLSAGILKDLAELLGPVASLGAPALLLIIFLNNAIKALIIIAAGIFVGVIPLLFVVFNGFAIGAVVSSFGSTAGWWVVAASLAPHGVLEIPLILMATAMGLMVGRESWRWLLRRKSRVKEQLGWSMKLYLKWILGGLFIAAVIEVFATPYFVRLAGGS